MAITIDGTNGFTTDNAALKLDGTTLVVDDTNNRVGIGTSSPSTVLEVSGSGVPAVINSSNNQFALKMSYANNTSSAYLGTFNNALVLAPSSGTASMTIDSAGRVTMPYQPYFMGKPQNDYSSGSMPSQFMPLNATINNGNHFNTSNSRFVAPVAGFYWIHWGGLQLASTVTSLYANGALVSPGNHYVGTPSYINMTQGIVYYLNANDYLQIYQYNGGGYYNSYWNWSVALLG